MSDKKTKEFLEKKLEIIPWKKEAFEKELPRISLFFWGLLKVMP